MSVDHAFQNDDDDILNEAYEREEKKKKRSLSDIRGPSGEALPESLQDALRDYVDTSGKRAQAQTPPEILALAQVLDRWSEMRNFQKQGAALVGVISLLDDITDNAATSYVRYAEAKRKIIYTKLLESNVRTVMSVMPEEFDGVYHMGELRLFLDIFLDFNYFSFHEAVAEYKHYTQVLNLEEDLSLIESGNLKSRTEWERELFGCPGAHEDEDV